MTSARSILTFCAAASAAAEAAADAAEAEYQTRRAKYLRIEEELEAAQKTARTVFWAYPGFDHDSPLRAQYLVEGGRRLSLDIFRETVLDHGASDLAPGVYGEIGHGAGRPEIVPISGPRMLI